MGCELGCPQGSMYQWGAHWRHLVNTTELSMCGSDAAFVKLLWPLLWIYLRLWFIFCY